MSKRLYGSDDSLITAGIIYDENLEDTQDNINNDFNTAINQLGPFMFDVDANGHLIMYYNDPFDPDVFSVNNAGHLILTFTTT